VARSTGSFRSESSCKRSAAPQRRRPLRRGKIIGEVVSSQSPALNQLSYGAVAAGDGIEPPFPQSKCGVFATRRTGRRCGGACWSRTSS
jgi:hypothetical protein